MPLEKKGFPVWGWLLPLVAIIAAFLGWRACSAPQGPKLASITLPCGTVLSVEEGTFNFNLATFLMKGSDSELPRTFVFDNLNFDSATTRLTPESNPTVTNLIAIMCPTMRKHTDSSGCCRLYVQTRSWRNAGRAVGYPARRRVMRGQIRLLPTTLSEGRAKIHAQIWSFS